MGAITITSAAKVRPLNGAITRRGTAGATLTPGQAVYLDGANGWKLADADAQASAQARGVVVSDGYGSVSFASGQVVDIVVLGPVEGYASMTPGGPVYVSPTAGALDQTLSSTAADYNFIIGWAEQATVLFVLPENAVPTAVPS
jgi:hypothetical protein